MKLKPSSDPTFRFQAYSVILFHYAIKMKVIVLLRFHINPKPKIFI